VPALLQPDQFEPWLSGELGKGVLTPAPEDLLQKVRVSTRVNSSRAPDGDATLIEPLAA
jgi:putative SOS response-associated peptidase YedK